MTKRPAIIELDDMTVGAQRPAPTNKTDPAPETVEAKPQGLRKHYAGQKTSYDPDVLRTSFYFHRAVHDKLREIAYTDRVSISSLIMTGLDKVLSEKGEDDTKTLIAKFREKKARKW
jgi:predicted DNA-binding ribbon-helix-helix protein